MSLINDLATVRERQGLPPLPDPGVIAGFGPNDPPAPPFLPREIDSPTGTVTDTEDNPVDDPFLTGGPPSGPPPSPLIPRRPAKLVAPEPPATPSLPLPDLIVLGTLGSWKGREVALTDAEERAIRATVLKALQRELAVDLSAAGVQRVRRAKAAPEPVLGQGRRSGRKGTKP